MNQEKLVIESSTQTSFSNKLHKMIDILAHDNMTVNLTFEENTTGLVLIELFGNGHLNLNLEFKANTDLNYLIVDQSDEALDIVETVVLHKNAHVNANYGEFSQGTHHKLTTFELIGEFASLNVRSATMTYGVANWKMVALHRAKDTYAMLKNYGVVFESGVLGFEVLGDIGKGYSRSKTHQETRVMNMAKTLKATVYPQLIIDENDVEASHAASVGQPDPEIIYYLQSRGLTYEQAIAQITYGYLIPVIDVIDDEVIKESLLNEIQQKVTLS